MRTSETLGIRGPEKYPTFERSETMVRGSGEEILRMLSDIGTFILVVYNAV
jgi:hypothetical protein